MDFYEVLSVPQNATAEELKKAYRAKVLEHHPDKNLDDTEGANVRFAKVKEAYETLSDVNLRSDYDYLRGKLPPKADGRSCPMDSFFASSSSSAAPSSFQRFTPQRYMSQSPAPIGPRSISLEEIVNFVGGVILYQEFGPLNGYSFHALIKGFFECLAYDESLHNGPAMHNIPSFGGMCHRWNSRDAVYCEEHRDGPFIEDFYKFWKQFRTKKDFAWKVFCSAPPQALQISYFRREVDRENNRIRRLYKAQYAEVICDLAKGLLDIDPRYHRYLLVQQDRNHDPQPKPQQNNNHNHNHKKNNKKNKKKKRGKR